MELIPRYSPKAAFVYATCIVGIIGDDVDAVCRRVSSETGIPVIPVHSEGFKGTKKDGYKAACDAISKIVGTGSVEGIPRESINILGEFNLAGEAWMIREYYEKMGIQVVSVMTGDGRVGDLSRAHGASLNVVQCSGSMTNLDQDDGGKVRNPLQSGVVLRHRGHRRRPLPNRGFFPRQAGDRRKGPGACPRGGRPPRLVNGKSGNTDRTWKGSGPPITWAGAFKAFSLINGTQASRHCRWSSRVQDRDQGGTTSGSGKWPTRAASLVDDSKPGGAFPVHLEMKADLFIGGV
jgi:nitrogenase molybdenum-cofactor synthesis protein NifE